MAKRNKIGLLGLSNTTLLLIGGGVALYYLATRKKTESVQGIGSFNREIYFKSQSSALEYAFDDVEKKYDIIFPDYIWAEHIPYGKSKTYTFELMTKNGNISRKGLVISLYRMESGNYELNYYIS